MALKSKAFQLPDRNWTVRNELVFAVVQAPTAKDAVAVALKNLGFEHKPWLGRKLTVKEATEEDLRRYAALAEAHRRSQPTVKSAKRKTVHERLGLFDG
jgi:hypothetical protein